LATPKKAKDSKKPADATTGTAAAAGSAQAQDNASSATAWTAVAGVPAELTFIDCSSVADACAAAETGPTYPLVQGLSSNVKGELHVIDSGTSEHMTPYRHMLTEYRSMLAVPINAANQTVFKGVGCGTLTLSLQKDQKTVEVKICDVLYALAMAATLILVGHLNDVGYKTLTKNGKMKIYNASGHLLATIPKTCGLYRITTGAASASALSVSSTLKISLANLHQQLGHCNYCAVLDMIRHGHITGVQLTSHNQPECKDCMLGKAERAVVAKTRTSPLADKYGNHIHLDLWGPARVQTVNHHLYAFFIVDDSNCWADAPTMQYKSEAFGHYVGWEAREEL
jgi:hypothetical protein